MLFVLMYIEDFYSPLGLRCTLNDVCKFIHKGSKFYRKYHTCNTWKGIFFFIKDITAMIHVLILSIKLMKCYFSILVIYSSMTISSYESILHLICDQVGEY